MSARLGVAVVGCGEIATSRHLPAIADEAGVRLIATCDADEGLALDAAGRFGAAGATADLAEVLGDPKVEAVVVATPPWVTPRVTIAALQAGKDVLCEKPMATVLEDARAVARAAEATGRLVQVGLTYRHSPLLAALRRWIAEGRLGRPVVARLDLFSETWDQHGDPAHRTRMLATLASGPPSVHDGAHAADHLHYLLDTEAVRAAAFALASRPEFPAPNYNLAWVELANGDRAALEVGWLYPSLPATRYELIGPAGRAWMDWAGGRAGVESVAGDDAVDLGEGWAAACFAIQLDHFLRCVADRSAPVPGVREGLASLGLTLAVAEALATGRPVDLAHDPSAGVRLPCVGPAG